MNGLAPDSSFAGYRVVRLIGAGGMGQVYLAQHPRLPREDALKILRSDISANNEFRERFIREADTAAGLFHPNIITVYDRGEFEGQLWLATQYIDGMDASRLFNDRYPAGMPIEDVADIVDAIASALDYAHGRGLLHRDVKPANILLGQLAREGHRAVYLADFGIARPLAEPSGLTETNLTVGTVAYASPEQLMGEVLDGRADQYSLAATAFHLLTGGQMHEASNPVAVISKHLTASPPLLSARRPDLAPFDSAFQIALSREPSQRFATCGQFASALRSGINGGAQQRETQVAMPIPQSASDSPVDYSTAQPAKSASKLKIAVISVAALIAVCAAVAGGTYALGGEKQSAEPVEAKVSPLNGSYELNFDSYKETLNGKPVPPRPEAGNSKSYFAIESVCTGAQCSGRGVSLDAKNPNVEGDQTGRSGIRVGFHDGKWQLIATRKADQPNCINEGSKVGPGTQTNYYLTELEPMADGKLRGVMTTTALTNECGNEGIVGTVPVIVKRLGDVPEGLSIREPLESLPDRTNLPQPVPGPTLDGVYRVGYTYTQQTRNGKPLQGSGGDEDRWWNFRSACSADRCIATGIELVDGTTLLPKYRALVLSYRDGEWISSPYPDPTGDCPVGAGSETTTTGYSLRPQSDGSLRGGMTITVVETECGGNPGDIYATPLTAVRTGNQSLAAINADPTLWLR